MNNTITGAVIAYHRGILGLRTCTCTLYTADGRKIDGDESITPRGAYKNTMRKIRGIL